MTPDPLLSADRERELDDAIYAAAALFIAYAPEANVGDIRRALEAVRAAALSSPETTLDRLEGLRVKEGDPAARMPYFDPATLIAGTDPETTPAGVPPGMRFAPNPAGSCEWAAHHWVKGWNDQTICAACNGKIERAPAGVLDEAALREALAALWAWAVKAGPFISAVLVLAEDKTPGLELLSEVPALREQVIATLAALPAADRAERGLPLDVERLAKTLCRLERDHDHMPYGEPDFVDWFCPKGQESAEDIAAEYARVTEPSAES